MALQSHLQRGIQSYGANGFLIFSLHESYTDCIHYHSQQIYIRILAQLKKETQVQVSFFKLRKRSSMQRRTFMRWALYCALFIAILFCSFWGYAWIFRIEFIQTALERSCPPYKIAIEAITIQDSQTVIISNLSILTKEASPKLLVHISKATLSSPTRSWFYWLFTPSTDPLHLKAVSFIVSQFQPLSFDHSPLNLILNIDTLTIEGPDNRTRNLLQFNGHISDVLKAAADHSC
jgi:hypothetical protein